MRRPDRITTRGLNRALLDRQWLLQRRKASPSVAVERLLGLQAQAPLPPYIALWSRVDGFRPEQLGRLLTDRKVVRIALMRSTVHLVTARDCLRLRPLFADYLARQLEGTSMWGPRLQGIDVEAVVAKARRLVEERPRPNPELTAELAEGDPDADREALGAAIRNRLPLVQLPPRGVWGVGGQVVYTTAESWLGEPLDPRPSLDDLLLRFFTAFGPATSMDAQTWSGLPALREIVDRLRPQLRTFVDEDGRELFDVPRGRRPDPDTPAPVRFLPEFDNALLSHADRRRIIAETHRKDITRVNGRFSWTVLVDGFVRAAWQVEHKRGVATLRIEPFEKLAKAERAAVLEEGDRLLAVLHPDATTADVVFAPIA